MSKGNDPTGILAKDIPRCTEKHYSSDCKYEYLEDWRKKDDNMKVFIAVRICKCPEYTNKEEFLKRKKIQLYETGRDKGVDIHKYVGTHTKVCEWRRVPNPDEEYIKFERICNCGEDDTADEEHDH